MPAVLIPERPEVPYKVTFQYQTDILTGQESGKEQRIALRPFPRWVIEWEYILAPAFDIRNADAALFTRLGDPVLLPIWHEEVFLNAAVDSADTVVFGDFSMSDAQPGETVFFHSIADESVSGSGIIDSGNDTSLTLTAPLGIDLPLGSSIFPTVECLLEDRPTISRYPVNAGRLPIKATSIKPRRLGGNGADFLEYRGRPLLTRRPLANDMLPDTYHAALEVLDFGNVLQPFIHRPHAAIERQRRFKIRDAVGRQYLKVFLEAVRGVDPFFIATWRTDLRLVE